MRADTLMVGILLIAHAPLASALSDCAQHVYSCEPSRVNERLRVLDVAPGADVDATFERAQALIAELQSDDGVLVLTDAFGATPGNIAARLNDPGRVCVVAGMNLPMLLRAVCYRGSLLAEVADKAVIGGQQGVLQVPNTSVQNQGGSTPPTDDLQRLHHQQ